MTPSWLPILRDALDLDYAAAPRIATLATVDPHHRPRARSVVIRRIDDDGSLHIATDARSDKHHHLQSTPFAELVFWLPKRREQFRLAGPVTLTSRGDNPALIDQMWQSLPAPSRALFTWPAPGLPWQGCDNAFAREVPATTPVPDCFELLTLRPDEVDHLQLTPTPHRRTRWLATNTWQPQDINP
jgi:PPOX class probable FMN-dependent enzyme